MIAPPREQDVSRPATRRGGNRHLPFGMTGDLAELRPPALADDGFRRLVQARAGQRGDEFGLAGVSEQDIERFTHRAILRADRGHHTRIIRPWRYRRYDRLSFADRSILTRRPPPPENVAYTITNA